MYLYIYIKQGWLNTHWNE